MSTGVAHSIRPLRSPERQPQRTPLRAVPVRSVRRARPKIAYAITTIAAVSGIVVAQLLSSVALSQGAYELSALKSQQRDLKLEQQSLTEQVEVLSSPQYISESAQELGMVINQSPVYIRLSDGSVLGQPGPGGEATERPLADGAVSNSLVDQLGPVGSDKDAAEKKESEDSTGAGESSSNPPPAQVIFENGLPSPKTH
ncbi:hypothetical protein [Paramicrobacterium agarici]|uniref:Cell division protein FtsL n=1 Tax=Paramicrobacterium agarici TaxID=630514 RepID=A0A2A9DXD4_9MICO|nr:hypothetical protein [Microbacterium agarici]PFG31457.1 cell division protein FtsL [Microbacterium agarici]TQO21345.1 cell division protein FtsL [Microbacterium agarici]